VSEKDFITLREASKNCEYSQEYLSLRARQGKLRAIKRGKKWVTTKDWLNKYIAQTEEYKEKLEEKRKEKPDTLEKKISDFLQSPSSEKTPAVPVSDEDSAEMFFDLPSTDFSDIEREIEAISFSNKLNRKPRKNRNNFALALSLALVLLLIGAVSARENILRFASKTNSYVESTGEVGEEIMTGSLKTAVQSLKTVSADVSFVVKRTKSDPNYTASVFRSFYGWANEEVRRAVSYIYEKGKEGAKDIEIGSEKIARDISKFFNKPFVLEKSEEPSKDFRPTTTEEKTYQQEIQFLQEEVRRLKEKGLVTKETVREVERVTQIQPVKEITKLTIDSASLSSMQEDIGQLKESVESTKDNVTVIEKTTYKTIDKAVSTPAAPHAPTRIGSTYITKDSISVTGTGSFTSNLTSGGNIKGEKIEIEDSNTYIEVDSSGNIAFTDSVTGTKTLAQLSSGSGSVLDLDGDFLTIDTDGDTQMKAYADDIISLDIGGAGTGEYLFSGTELNSGAATIDSTLVLSSGSITDSGGTIDFGDENLTTTGDITGGNLNVSDWDTGFYETGGVVKQYNPDYDEDFVFGSSQLADAGATYDSRFFFDKSKAAFRAGKVTETEWDDANVGDYSVAFGHNTKSTGDGSISLGYNLGSASVIESTGPGSFSGGYTSGTALNIIRASNNGSFAFGEVSGGLSAYGTIIASGQGSVAMGRGLGRADILSSGTGSIALGYANAANLTATGNASVAIGEDVNATANNALSFGKSFTNNTASSFAVGFGRQNLTVTDGNITMAATEDLVFDMTGSTANTVSLSSSTGVDTIDFGSFALTTTGKITASGGVDPPYVLYDPQTRDRLVARVLEEVPLDKQRGASLYYNEETDQLEVYFADRDKFFEVAMTEIQLEEDGSVAGANIDTENDSYFIQKVKKAVSYLGLKIENGIASVRELVTEKLVAKTARMNKMEMVDQATGQAYCTWIENGVWKKVKGSCEEKSNMGGAVNAGSGSNSGNSQDNSDRGDDKEDGVNAGDSQDAADAGDTGDNEGSEDDSDINSATDDSDNGNTENSTDSVDAGEVADTDDTGSSDDKEDGVNAGDSQDAADAGDTGGNEGSENDSDINSTTDDSDNDDTEGGSSGSAGNSENTTNSDNSAEGDSDTGGSGDAGSTGGNGLDNASAGDSGDGGGNSNGSEGGDSGTGGTGDTGNAEAAGGSSGGDAPSN